MRKSIHLFLLSGASVLSLAMPANAHAGDVSVSATIDVVSDYVFRGVSLADTAIQPGIEFAKGGLTAGAWFSTGIGDTSALAADELDLYIGYSADLSELITADVGVTYYHYPQGGGLFETDGGLAGTYEAYAGLSFDAPLSPSVTAYYDMTLEALTLEGGISHSTELSDKTSLDVGLTAGLVDGDGFSYEYGQASAAVSYAFSDTTSAYIGANYAISSENTLNYSKILAGAPKDNLLFFGAGIASGF